MLIIFKFPCNFFFATSLNVCSEPLTAFQDKSSLKLIPARWSQYLDERPENIRLAVRNIVTKTSV